MCCGATDTHLNCSFDMSTTRILLITTALCVAVSGTVFAQNTRSLSMKETLKGTPEPPKTQFKTRGFTPRGAPSANQVQKEIKKRSLYISRGVTSRGATPQAAFFGDAKTKVTEVKAPASNPNHNAKGDLGVHPGEDAYLVEYHVDPTSQLKGEIFFNKGNAEIKSGSGSTRFLVDLAIALRDPELRDMKFIIEGHASAEGSAINNKVLSQKRADKIHSMLVEYGVNPHQVFAVGFGEDEAQFGAHASEWQLATDRRVLIYKLED